MKMLHFCGTFKTFCLSCGSKNQFVFSSVHCVCVIFSVNTFASVLMHFFFQKVWI